jgi:hypothetical protein
MKIQVSRKVSTSGGIAPPFPPLRIGHHDKRGSLMRYLNHDGISEGLSRST